MSEQPTPPVPPITHCPECKTFAGTLHNGYGRCCPNNLACTWIKCQCGWTYSRSTGSKFRNGLGIKS